MKVVGIGASAGGVDALKKFLDNLAPDIGAAYVIVQHLSPNFRSVMEDLLKSHTSMPISKIGEDLYIEANHIYLMPSNKTLTYQYGLLKLHDRDHSEKLNLPIDKFFHSLGEGLKKDAVGIILSGSGTDGSRGARTIKEQEGLVLAQSPESAEFDGMPRALINLGIADATMTPENLAIKLKEILALDVSYLQEGPNENVNLDSSNVGYMDRIIELASSKSDIPFDTYKVPTLYRRIEKQRIIHELPSLSEYYEFLVDNEQYLDILAREFLINVTRFFRDSEVFDKIIEKVLPGIFENLEEGEVCRIWVVACSTGEEAYTLGMIIKNYIEENNISNDFKIFASDVNPSSIDFATQGCFNASISSDVPSMYLNKYFIEDGGNYYVKSALREKIIFAIHDAILDPSFIKMDLISCRNFLIYLKLSTQQKILKTFYFSLKESKYLLLGPSESLGELNNVFKNVDRHWNIFIKEDISQSNTNREYPQRVSSRKRIMNRNLSSKNSGGEALDQLVEEFKEPFSEMLINQHVPRVLFVSEAMKILYMKGDFSKIFGLPRNSGSMTLNNMIPKAQALIIRDGIRLAVESAEVHRFDNIIFEKRSKQVQTNITFEKFEFPEIDFPVVKITIQYEVEHKGIDEESSVKTVHINEENYITDRVLRLESQIDLNDNTTKLLQEKLNKITEQLNTSNQELLASNEELQSSNEELQSLNEELHTVNQELQYKNAELSASNNDMNNLLTSTQIGTIFLDENLNIRKFTPAITSQFQLLNSDIGRSISSFSNKLNDVDIVTICKDAIKNEREFEQEIKGQRGKNFLLRVIPYKIDQDEINGVVITLIDIDSIVSKRRHKDEKGSYLDTYLKSNAKKLLLVNVRGKIEYANKEFDVWTSNSTEVKYLEDIFEVNSIKKFDEAVEKIKINKKEKVLTGMYLSNYDNVKEFTLHIVPLFKDNNKDIEVLAIRISNDSAGE